MSLLKLPFRLSASSGHKLLAYTSYQQCDFGHVHSSAALFKHVLETELIYKNIKYSRISYPKRPNDPRVPSNPEFAVTNADKKYKEQSDSSGMFSVEESKSKNSISKAMQIYLERARSYGAFIKEQEEEFDFGKRHLANIMGVELNSLTQEDIDLAIQYLMPSGLFDPRARPKMKPPKEIFPSIKEAQFSSDGRPFNPFFFTGKSSFYQACYEVEEEFNRLKDYEDSQIRSNILEPPPDSKSELKLSVWLSHKQLCQLFLEKIELKKYESFIFALERLLDLPYSKLSNQFLMKYRQEVPSAAQLVDIPPLKYDENNRPYMNAKGKRKHCIAHVTVRGNGTGKVDINGRDILFFDKIQDREQILTPLKFCGLLFKVDIECRTMHQEYEKEWSEDAPPFPKHIRELGTSAQSGAIRLALSTALKSFVDSETVEKMRLVGLLTPDPRIKERKKWGQEGARRKYTWKKR